MVPLSWPSCPRYLPRTEGGALDYHIINHKSVPRTIGDIEIIFNENSREFCKPSFVFILCVWRPLQSLDPDPVRIFQIQTGFLDLGHNGTSDTKNKYYKTCQLSRKSIYWHFEYLSQLVGPRAPDPYTDQETGFTTLVTAGLKLGFLNVFISTLK